MRLMPLDKDIVARIFHELTDGYKLFHRHKFIGYDLADINSYVSISTFVCGYFEYEIQYFHGVDMVLRYSTHIPSGDKQELSKFTFRPADIFMENTYKIFGQSPIKNDIDEPPGYTGLIPYPFVYVVDNNRLVKKLDKGKLSKVYKTISRNTIFDVSDKKSEVYYKKMV